MINIHHYELLVAEGPYLPNVAADLSKKVTEYYLLGFRKDGDQSITVYEKKSKSISNGQQYYIISQSMVK